MNEKTHSKDLVDAMRIFQLESYINRSLTIKQAFGFARNNYIAQISYLVVKFDGNADIKMISNQEIFKICFDLLEERKINDREKGFSASEEISKKLELIVKQRFLARFSEQEQKKIGVLIEEDIERKELVKLLYTTPKDFDEAIKKAFSDYEY